ncbi:MAG: 16S rRNA (adenine(1518)-N(6)/adenine(1519)-N(6))-dimethyltransferase RsmA [Candidatus Eremiobacteraeota bacterium]|nr:16S rRNA (adenine(1518)-N(6)/adenine(1519)-N(6))-dimethyltransferase RsmA [Candidatus Eremiobacteraeota bacterium]MBV9700086.1 16S rRNA (adenine(1518)-N(6)/adenine(1519)-N(6))-dimethyltransferase RsmA [Candidatus Eremiobacteraeota bacterium]
MGAAASRSIKFSGGRPKKRFGQNFLVNASAARQIARLSQRDAVADVRTLEIGAGTGALTAALLELGARVSALEIDTELVALLRARPELARAEIIEADALTFDYEAWAGSQPWIVAGNLPYNVATPLILRLVELSPGPQSMTVMVQRDVADRFAASPGTAAYGSLSIAVQYAMQVQRAMRLSPRSFFPAPKVESTVVKLTRRDTPPVQPRYPDVFWKVVRGAFAYRRKTLVNALHLSLGFDRARIERALEHSNLSPELRGERLNISDFARLADALAAQ